MDVYKASVATPQDVTILQILDFSKDATKVPGDHPSYLQKNPVEVGLEQLRRTSSVWSPANGALFLGMSPFPLNLHSQSYPFFFFAGDKSRPSTGKWQHKVFCFMSILTRSNFITSPFSRNRSDLDLWTLLPQANWSLNVFSTCFLPCTVIFYVNLLHFIPILSLSLSK